MFHRLGVVPHACTSYLAAFNPQRKTCNLNGGTSDFSSAADDVYDRYSRDLFFRKTLNGFKDKKVNVVVTGDSVAFSLMDRNQLLLNANEISF
jgi:hypothetical protein